jgi:ABC-type nitrate/sulfonate/bicarbonate transport system ATPase subunit
MLAGLLVPSSGRIVLHAEGEDPLSNIGMVFQRPALLPWRNVLSNILLPTQIVGMNRDAALDRAKGLLQLVGLADAGPMHAQVERRKLGDAVGEARPALVEYCHTGEAG